MAHPVKCVLTVTDVIEPTSFSVPEASQYARIGRSCLYAAIAAGKLPSLKIGRSRRLLRKDVDQYLETFRVTK
jgi:excisionase family DNA binding protein